jgi:hypothetical protein
LIAPEIPIEIDPLGGVRIIYMVIGPDGWLEERQALVSGGLIGWEGVRELLDDPNTISWQAVQE